MADGSRYNMMLFEGLMVEVVGLCGIEDYFLCRISVVSLHKEFKCY